MRSYLLKWIDYYKKQAYGFCNINEMIINTTTDKRYMSHKYYIEHPIQMIERRLHFVIDTNPQLLNALDCSKKHPLIRNCSHICEQRFYLQNVYN